MSVFDSPLSGSYECVVEFDCNSRSSNPGDVGQPPRRIRNNHIVDEHMFETDPKGIVAFVERRIILDMMLKVWDDGYWPSTPVRVNWYRFGVYGQRQAIATGQWR